MWDEHQPSSPPVMCGALMRNPVDVKDPDAEKCCRKPTLADFWTSVKVSKKGNKSKQNLVKTMGKPNIFELVTKNQFAALEEEDVHGSAWQAALQEYKEEKAATSSRSLDTPCMMTISEHGWSANIPHTAVRLKLVCFKT